MILIIIIVFIQIVLDKVVGIEKVKPAFGKSKCYICLEQIGFCIQCSSKRCHSSFHVSCAQEADLIKKTEIGPPNYSAGMITSTLLPRAHILKRTITFIIFENINYFVL